MSDGIEVSRDGAVMSAAFARPEKRNAITSAMYEALILTFDEAERDESVCALLLSGKGGVFTAGNDIGDFLAAAIAAAGARDPRGSPGWRFVSRLAVFEKPLIAAIEGNAVGIGTTLCFHCDLVYAAPSARFQMPFVNLGLVPEAGSSLLAPQRFGRAIAAEFLLLAEPFDATRAHALGLVNEVLPAADLLAHAMTKAQVARRQAELGADGRPPPHARRPGGAEGQDDGRDRSLRRRTRFRRSARGLRGVPVADEGVGASQALSAANEEGIVRRRGLNGANARRICLEPRKVASRSSPWLKLSPICRLPTIRPSLPASS